MSHLFIKDITAGMQVNDIYMVTQPVLRNTTRGDLYIAMYLSDCTGRMNGRMWQVTQQLYAQLPTEGFVQIRGKSELYQGSMQMVVNDIQVIEPEQVSLSDYLPRTDKDVAGMFRETKEMLLAIEDAGLKSLVDEFLSDVELMRQFCTAPAAMQMHHSYLGGLLEHTHNMLKVASAVLPRYPKVRPGLVLAGIFLHDIAKTCEMSYKMAFGYTDQGQLLGHIVQAVQMISKRADIIAQKGTPVDSQTLDCLLHIIVSHHGRYEFGSPKLPAIPEAVMVNYIDDLDAKMNQVTNLIDNDPGNSNWTGYIRALETKLYKNPPAAE